MPSEKSRWTRSSGAERGIGQHGSHGCDVGFGEAEGLEVGEAPPRFAEARLEVERGAVGGDRFVELADRLEHGAEAEQQARLARRAGEDGAVGRDRLVEAAEAAEDRGLEVEVADLVGFLGEDGVEQLQRVGVAPGAVEDEREVGARRGEGGLELDCAAEEGLGVAQPADATGELGHHADRSNVERVVLEVRA